MTSTTQANLEAIQSWAAANAYPTNMVGERVEVEVPINNTKITANFFTLSSGVVLLITLDLGAEQPKIEEIGMVTMAINNKMPFGNFDIQFPEGKVAFLRISTIIDSAPSESMLDSMVRWAGHSISKYSSILTVVAQGLIDAQTAIRRLDDIDK